MNKCILIICVGVGVATLGIEQAVGNEWPGFGGPTADFRSSRSDNLAELPIVPRLQWRKTLGPGLSGLVVSGDFVYACYLDPQADQREVVVALHRKTGRTIWEQSYHAPLDTQQEVFGGRSRSPQATPLVIGDRLVTIGFSGIMHAFDLRTGRIAWKRSLVKEYSAVPVQFGFSSSPIEVDGRLVVCAGGKGGGLICLDVKDGSMIWNVACDEASYATPVILEVEGTRQIVFVTRNEIVGVEANTGARFWQYNLPQRELTNVPTPLITSDGGLIVSGQGVGGTAKLNIRLSGREWKVDEAWMNTFQFFYCNWVLHNERVIGCQGDLLIAFDSRTGERLGRWRGFGDANVCLLRDRLLLIDGEGILSTVRITEDALTIETRHRLWNQRVWTPPAVPGRQLLSRSGNQISAVELHGGDSGESLAVETASRRRLVIAPAQHESVDPIAKVTQAFEDRGLEGATQVYSSLRNAQALTARDHLDLAEMAAQQGLTEMAKQIAEDAVRDFGDNALLDPIHRLLAELKRKPSSVINRGDNGLDYIELAIRNNTPSTLQTEVQGPAKHPFSYGIPFPSGTVRIERWPIGTKLFRTRGELRGRVLLEVGNEDAGQTIDLSSDRSLRSEDKSGSLPRDES